MIPESHPYWHVRSVVERRPDITSLSFSYYKYRPQSLVDERTTWRVSVSEFLDPDSIERFIGSAPPEEELALHSELEMHCGELMHLVMVDMSTAARAHLDKLRSFLGDTFFHQIAWYASGRSFHGYGEGVLTKCEWVQFMGLLLLSNKPRLDPIVDPRWIGHRLLAGYSALRWTKNTSHYLALPASIDRQARVTSSSA